MRDIIKAIRLNLLLGKNVVKFLIYFIFISTLLTYSNKNLLVGILTSMTLIPMKGVSLIFQYEEKTDIRKLYGFLPIKKYNLVLGRYFYIIIIGLFSLFFSLFFQILLLEYLNINLTSIEVTQSILLGTSFYIFNIALQIPGFYKFGTITGSYLSYIPLIFFMVGIYSIGEFTDFRFKAISLFFNNLTSILLFSLLISMILLLVSIIFSLLIYKENH